MLMSYSADVSSLDLASSSSDSATLKIELKDAKEPEEEPGDGNETPITSTRTSCNSGRTGLCSLTGDSFGEVGKVEHFSPRNNLSLPDFVARAVFKKMVKCVKRLHDAGIVHGDIKLENFVMGKDSLDIRLIDFEFATPHIDEFYCEHWRGTLYYAPPELVLRVAYNPRKADVYSLGVCLYCMIHGSMPFYNDQDIVIADMIVKDKPFLGNDLVDDLLKKMLEKDPDKRPTIDEVLEHRWLMFDAATRIPLPPMKFESEMFLFREVLKDDVVKKYF